MPKHNHKHVDGHNNSNHDSHNGNDAHNGHDDYGNSQASNALNAASNESNQSLESAHQNMHQNKYFELQLLDEQARQVQQQLIAVDQQIAEVSLILDSIEEIKESKDSEVLVPFANGLYLKAKILDTENMIINVGSQSMVEKKNHEVKELLARNIWELDNYKAKLLETLQALLDRVEKIEKEIQQ